MMDSTCGGFDGAMGIVVDRFVRNCLAHATTFLVCDFIGALVTIQKFCEWGSPFNDLTVGMKTNISYRELDSSCGSDCASVSYHCFCDCVFSNTEEVVEGDDGEVCDSLEERAGGLVCSLCHVFRNNDRDSKLRYRRGVLTTISLYESLDREIVDVWRSVDGAFVASQFDCLADGRKRFSDA